MMTDILIKDPVSVDKKIAMLKDSGCKNLHIISDFDKTLTEAFVGDKKVHSIMALIRDNNYLSPDYSSKAFALFDKFHPIEISVETPLKEKKAKMQEWWSSHLKLLIDSGMNKKVIDDIIKKELIKFRKGALELLDIAFKFGIPLVIFSSALGDVIVGLLKAKGKLSSNVHVISNFFDFDEAGFVKGYKSDIIHVFNKDEFQVQKKKYFQSIKDRKNVILLGDSLGDARMSEGIPHDVVFRIGLLNSDIEKNKKAYMDAFDVVLYGSDISLDYVSSLIKDICGPVV